MGAEHKNVGFEKVFDLVGGHHWFQWRLLLITALQVISKWVYSLFKCFQFHEFNFILGFTVDHRDIPPYWICMVY